MWLWVKTLASGNVHVRKLDPSPGLTVNIQLHLFYGSELELPWSGNESFVGHVWGVWKWGILYTLQMVPSGKLTKSYRQWPTEIVDLPINSMVIFHSYVSLPEGKLMEKWWLANIWCCNLLLLKTASPFRPVAAKPFVPNCGLFGPRPGKKHKESTCEARKPWRQIGYIYIYIYIYYLVI